MVQKRLAVSGGAAFLPDMRLIFIAEIFNVERTGLGAVFPRPQRAPSLIASPSSSSFIDIAFFALAGNDSLLESPACAWFPRGRSALSAGFVYPEVQEEPGHVNHAVVLVHNDETAGSHHGADCQQVIIIDLCIDQGSRGCSRPKGRRSGLL